MAKGKKSFFSLMILGNNNRISSKRVLGSFVIIVMTIMVVVCVFIKDDASWLSSAIDTLIITGGALLGLGIADNAFSGRQDFQNGKYNNGGNNGGGNYNVGKRQYQKYRPNQEEYCDEFNG